MLCARRGLDCFLCRKAFNLLEAKEKILTMICRLLYILVALFTFIIGALAADTYQTFVTHGLSPVRRIFRLKPRPVASAPSEHPARIDIQPMAKAGEYTAGLVAIYFKTDVDGQVDYVHAITADPVFYQQGVAAAYQMRFPRRKYRGQPVSSAGLVMYKFVNGRRIVLDLDIGKAIECPN